jgi:hypothetical protein
MLNLLRDYLFDPKTDHEQIFFEGGIIENVILKEK